MDCMLYDWRASYYDRDTYTEEARTAERKRRVDLGEFVIQRDAPGGAKQFRAFSSIDDAYEFIISKPEKERTFYETIFDAHPRQKPHFDLDIVPTEDDPMDHAELLNQLLTEIKRVVGPELDLVNDIGVYSSHAADGSKRSYHVVLTGYYVRGNVEAGNFAKAIRDGMIAATEGSASREAIFITKCVDLLVYKKLQQFRLLGCTKLGRNRYKAIVLEYSAAGRSRQRPPVTDIKAEFRRSLLSYVEQVEDGCGTPIPKFLDPQYYMQRVAPVDPLLATDEMLRSMCSKKSFASFSSISTEELWIMTASDIVAHVIDSSHLTSDLASSCRTHAQTSTNRGALISLRAPPGGGYWCVLCERRHDHENPYLTLREDTNSEAATEDCPKVVAIIYHCRRDPTSSMRLCSMRGGLMSSFTCVDKPHDPRQGEKRTWTETSGSAAVDC
jgi:hypothetical protein